MKRKEKRVVGRFAPTPSGRMHLGNAFSALVAWLAARAAGGRMVLRIEDLDQQRTTPERTRTLLEDLTWLGLDWDEGPGASRPGVPYLQSERQEYYEEAMKKLSERARVYPCYCTRAQLHASTAPHLGEEPPVYDGRCRGLPDERRAQKQGRSPALRVEVPDEKIYFQDRCRGDFCQNLARECGDFILRRNDGTFAYQLAVAVDDGEMGITQVVRGRDLLSSTPRQIWLMRLLGFSPPEYGHLPLLLAPDGRRLAKRDKDLDLGALRARLSGPEPLLGLLAGAAGVIAKAEPVSAGELIPLFSWAGLVQEDIVISEGFLDGIL